MNNRRRNLVLGLMGMAAAASWPLNVMGAETGTPKGPMDALTAIKTRRSVRTYTREPVSDADIQTILEAGMLAPSAANEQPWEFVVIHNPETLAKAGDINQYVAFAKRASVAILLCLNEKKEKIKGMSILDMGTCAENMLLAAHALGLGAVFTGIYPIPDRIKGFQELCGLPDYVIPITLIVIGHPEIPGLREAPDRINPASVHQEKWNGKE